MGDKMNFLILENVGDNFCEMGGNVTKALRMVGYLLFVAKLFVPIIIVGFATFDLYKSVMEGSTDSLSKQLKAIGFRLIIGILIFFLPTFVNILLTQLGSDKSEYANCQTCLLEPFDCN